MIITKKPILKVDANIEIFAFKNFIVFFKLKKT